MDATRGKLSNVGKAWSHNLKNSGKTLTQLESLYAKRIFNSNFENLNQAQRNTVWKEIVTSAGRQRPSANTGAKAMGIAGRALVVLAVAMVVYNISTAEDKTRQTAKEGAILASSVGGMAAGGYVASLACGPGAFICATAWTFALGAAAAVSAEITFDMIW
ncbi:hypothetical protein [Endozoicomonas numazuensis]|uniref:hypothetical protein n=1 Tax=Endozoicomonas numazuensis TaxID=1137799 RepID=UPI00068A94A0|nr:hypothetical protein [Endozoicomonas numazuensis]